MYRVTYYEAPALYYLKEVYQIYYPLKSLVN